MARKSNQPVIDHLPVVQADGRYHYYWTQEGKQRHVSASDQMGCIMAYTQKYKDIEAGLIDVNANTPVKVWAVQWFQTYKIPKSMTPKSRRMYLEKLNKYILPAIGRYPLKQVTELHLQQILNASAGMSSSHLKKLRCVMRELFGKAYDLGYMTRNPASGLELPTCSEGKRRSLTERERRAFWQICRDGQHRGCLFYQAMLLCGLRPGECAALQWKHIHFDEARIYVEQAKESGSNTTKDPKTKSGFRKVPIPPDLLKQFQQRRSLPLTPVFLRQNGTAHTDDSLRAMWSSWKREMDRRMAFDIVVSAYQAKTEQQTVEWLRHLDGDFSPEQLAKKVRSPLYRGPASIVTYRNKLVLHGEPPELLASLVAYDLRHTYCTDLQKAGVDLKTASYLMGHADIQTTANIYSHTDDALVDVAAQKICAYTGSQKHQDYTTKELDASFY